MLIYYLCWFIVISCSYHELTLVYRDLVLLSRVNRRLTKGTKYPRMEDPAKGVTRKGTSLLRYLHADGSSCPPFSANTASERTLAMGATTLPRKSPSSTRREKTPPHSCLARIAFSWSGPTSSSTSPPEWSLRRRRPQLRTPSPPEKQMQ